MLPLARFAHYEDWPSCIQLNAEARAFIPEHPLQFSEQPLLSARARNRVRKELQKRETTFVREYLREIVQDQRIPTRPSNWHDFFNAMTWFSFPRSKSILSKLNFETFSQFHNTANTRSSLSDFFTKIDEGGLLFVTTESAAPALKSVLLEKDRAHKISCYQTFEYLSAFIFGHGIYECLHSGNFETHALSLVLTTSDMNFFAKNLQEQIAEADKLFCEFLQSEGKLTAVAEEKTGFFYIKDLAL